MAVCWSAKLPAVTLLALTAALKQKWSGTRCGFWVGFWEGKGGGAKVDGRKIYENHVNQKLLRYFYN